MIGKRYQISGMIVEVIADEEDKWKTRNITTNEIVFFNKDVLDKAIRLAMAEEVTGKV